MTFTTLTQACMTRSTHCGGWKGGITWAVGGGGAGDPGAAPAAGEEGDAEEETETVPQVKTKRMKSSQKCFGTDISGISMTQKSKILRNTSLPSFDRMSTHENQKSIRKRKWKTQPRKR